MRHKALLQCADAATRKQADDEFLKAYDVWKKRRESLVQIFFEAVHSGNRDQIIEIADAVAFFKDKLSPESYADKLRFELLFLKGEMAEDGKTGGYTLRQIAKKIGYKSAENSTDREDGYSVLRRKCKELGIAIKPARPATRK